MTAAPTVTVRIQGADVPGQRDAFLALLGQALQARAGARVPAGDTSPRTGASNRTSDTAVGAA